MTFELDARLREDTIEIGRLPLSGVRLHLDARYPWVVLVPERADVREIHSLSAEDRSALIEEAAAVSESMQHALGADKMNVASLGNMVPQLHVHVVARFEGDDAWPGAIWGAHPPLHYTPEAREQRVTLLQDACASIERFEAVG